MISFAKIIGIILHPVVLALTGIFVIVQKNSQSLTEAIYWTFLSGLFSLIIGAFVLFGVKKGFFNNFDVSNQKQRVILYPFVILIVVMFGILVFATKGPVILIQSSIIFSLSLMLLDLVNSKIKASIHVASVSALATGLVLLYGLQYLPAFLLVPISAYARVTGRRHTLSEVIVGAVCGVLLTLGGVYIVQLLK
jgi:hypothetical protein